jgi:hypothetical protein
MHMLLLLSVSVTPVCQLSLSLSLSGVEVPLTRRHNHLMVVVGLFAPFCVRGVVFSCFNLRHAWR